MPDDLTEQMGHAADACVRLAAAQEVVLDYTPESVAVLDDMIGSFWGQGGPSAEAFEKVALALGSYLGEVMVRNLGGRWVHNDEYDTASVVVGEATWFPVAKIVKRLREPGNGLVMFYEIASEGAPPARRRRFGRH